MPRGGFFLTLAQAANEAGCEMELMGLKKKGGLPVASSQLHVTKPGPVHSHMQRESENKKRVTPPCFIFMSQRSVSEVSSPLATQAPPPSLCSTTYESHLCLDPKSPSLHTPCRVYMLCVYFLTETIGWER